MRKIIQYILKPIAKLILWKYKPFVVAITGSVGKSSSKEAIFAVLNHHFPNQVRKTKKNLNTEIGLPLSIIDGEDAKRNIFLWLKNFLKGLSIIIFPVNYPKILVLEMAADKPGDISYLTSIVKPNISVITAIGEMPVHLEFFPSLESYINEKAGIIKGLKPNGKVILNYDDELLRGLAGSINSLRADLKSIFFGFNEKSNIRASHPRYTIPNSSKEIDGAGISFKVEYDGKTIPFKIQKTFGKGAIYSVLVATAIGLEMGVGILEISKSLEKFRPLAGRLNLIEGIKNTIIIDDTYNASPLSMELALDVLSQFENMRKIAVIGDMRELGVNTEKAHRQIGKRAGEVADIVFLIGDNMVFAKEELEKEIKEGEKREIVFWFRSGEEAKMKVQEILKEGDVILMKGSQSIRMEKIVKEVMAEPRKAKELLVRQHGHWLKT